MMHQHAPLTQDCLAASDIVDYTHPAVAREAARLAAASGTTSDLVRNTYLFVRDSIAHSVDCRGTAVTCTASEVLLAGQGLCYAKSHLLAALLRANGIAAGFCYQLLGFEHEHDPHRVLHGLNAVWLEDRKEWRRLDARGNKPGVDARFLPEREQLAFDVHPQWGEKDYPYIFSEPDANVVAALQGHTHLAELLPQLPQQLAREADIF
jgi:transglutaminase-like putative cysteine protease